MSFLKSKWILMLAALAVILAISVACRLGSEQVSPDSSIPVAPEFTDFYEQNGGVATIGLPISGIFEFDELQVQYFQRMRLEIDVGQNRIQITPLGTHFWDDKDIAANAVIVGEFLEFYEMHGGADVFGAPLSNQFVEGERWVQYFENGMLEWHPDNPAAARVQVAELGRVHYLRSGAIQAHRDQTSRNHLAPLTHTSFAGVILNASVSSPVLYGGEEQSLHVEAVTQEGLPVANQIVRIILSYNKNEPRNLPEQRTNDEGKLDVRLIVPDAEPGETVQVQVNIMSTLGEILGSQAVTYRIWW
jgi:hypothetical protein